MAALISGAYGKSWVLSPHCRKLIDALPLPVPGKPPASPVTQFPPRGKAVRPTLHQRHSVRAPEAHQCRTLRWILLFTLGLNYTVSVHDCAYAHVVTLVTALFWCEVAIRKHHRGLAGIRARDKLVPISISYREPDAKLHNKGQKVNVPSPRFLGRTQMSLSLNPLPSSFSVVSLRTDWGFF